MRNITESFTKRGNTWQFNISRVVDGKQKTIRKGGLDKERSYGSSFTSGIRFDEWKF